MMPQLIRRNLLLIYRLLMRWLLDTRPLKVLLLDSQAAQVQVMVQVLPDNVDLINNNENVVLGNLLVKLQQRDYLIGPASMCR
jgi:hypothetical protein